MKYTMIFLLAAITACKPPQRTVSAVPVDVEQPGPDTVIIHDTLWYTVETTVEIHDTVLQMDTVSSAKCDSCIWKNSRLREINDSAMVELIHAQSQIARVRYYLNICLRNPSQKIYLTGWVRRALE